MNDQIFQNLREKKLPTFPFCASPKGNTNWTQEHPLARAMFVCERKRNDSWIFCDLTIAELLTVIPESMFPMEK
jgi:hypothetical protein